MKIEYGDHEIEMLDDNFYVENLSKYNYQFKYSGGNTVAGRSYTINKRGIIVREVKSKVDVSSTILCENGGRTTINDELFKIADGDLLICIGDKIYCLNIPNLKINWFKEAGLGTNYSIHNFKEDFLIYGELGLSRINRVGKEIWSYKGGNGIFIPGKEKLAIKENMIELIDGNGKKYMINEFGKEIDEY